jgi:hypothetical protein
MSLPKEVLNCHLHLQGRRVGNFIVSAKKTRIAKELARWQKRVVTIKLLPLYLQMNVGINDFRYSVVYGCKLIVPCFSFIGIPHVRFYQYMYSWSKLLLTFVV